MLEDELVVVAMGAYPFHPVLKDGATGLAVRHVLGLHHRGDGHLRRTDIGCLTFHVLRVAHASHEMVHLTATVTAAHYDRFAMIETEWLEHCLTKVLEVGDGVYWRFVAEVMAVGRCRAGELNESEVWCQAPMHDAVVRVVVTAVRIVMMI